MHTWVGATRKSTGAAITSLMPCPVSKPLDMTCSLPQEDTPDIVLLPGDLSYADDYNLIDKFGYQPRWDIWGRLSQSVFATIPLVTGIGARQHALLTRAPCGPPVRPRARSITSFCPCGSEHVHRR